MAKKGMKSNADIEKNIGRTGNSKNFRKGTRPETYGEAEEKQGGHVEWNPVDYGNEVGGIPNANENKNKIYDKKLKTPKEPVLNAVSMPNRNKMNKKDYKVTSHIGDGNSSANFGSAEINVGGTPKPNKIN